MSPKGDTHPSSDHPDEIGDFYSQIKLLGANTVLVETCTALTELAIKLRAVQEEQHRMQQEMDYLRRTCYRGFKTGTAGHFLKDELWDPPI